MTRTAAILLSALAVSVAPLSATAATLEASYLDGGSWGTIFAQGFSPSVGSSPSLGLAAGDTVKLESFEFFKSGSTDSASNLRLAVIQNLFANLAGLTDSSAAVIGLSTNTVASTASLATGDAIAFDFAGLPLTYGGEYAAVFVNVGGGGELTPVLVSALTANYVDNGTGTFVPQTNYGTDSQFQFAVSNFISSNAFGSFFNTFSFAADANFRATFSAVPEPSSVLLVVGGALTTLLRRK